MWSEQMLYIAQEKGYIGVNEVIQFVLLQVPVSDEVISLPSYVTEDLCVFVNIVCNCIKNSVFVQPESSRKLGSWLKVI